MQIDQPEDMNDDVVLEGYTVDDPTSIDLENYANSFSGLAKLNRLIFIADHCPALRLEALKMAINYVTTSTYNVALYQLLHKQVIIRPFFSC